MTNEKCYLITEKELHEYFQLAEEAYTYKYAADKRDEIRSRPAASSTPVPEVCTIRANSEKMTDHLTTSKTTTDSLYPHEAIVQRVMNHPLAIAFAFGIAFFYLAAFAILNVLPIREPIQIVDFASSIDVLPQAMLIALFIIMISGFALMLVGFGWVGEERL